jgi:dynamin 1-like protein
MPPKPKDAVVGVRPQMESLIPVINRLQDIFSRMGFANIDLPQIAVVGAQSAGKSSVLENLVGKDFLPRGSGIVTRRPLVLQLVNGKPGTPEYGEFLHKPGRKFTDFEEIRTEIDADTERIAGDNKGISDVPINLKITSPHVLNLTLVDLPGLMKVPVGDQPPDIAKQTRRLIESYTKKESCIILAVTPANTDLATSDSLQMAKQMDPKGIRTLGVLTKLDLMDAGTDASDILKGNVFSLRRGFIGIVNRSQADIAGRKSIKDAHAAEIDFFRNHEAYKNLHGVKLGTKQLAQTLNQTLMVHIHDCLPSLSRRINSLTEKTRAQMATFGDTVPGDSNKEVFVRNMLLQFEKRFRALIEGGARGAGGDSANAELVRSSACHSPAAAQRRRRGGGGGCHAVAARTTYFTSPCLARACLRAVWWGGALQVGGARINFIFHEVYARALAEVDPLQGITAEKIRLSFRNSAGQNASIFIPESTFENLVKPQIARLKGPSLECAELVYQELMRMVFQCSRKDMKRFGKMVEAVTAKSESLLRTCLKHTRQMISDVINMEMAYINIHHPDFIGTLGAIRRLMQEKGITYQDTKEVLAMEDEKRRAAAKKVHASEGTLGTIKNIVKKGYVQKRGRNFPWTYGKRYMVLEGTKTNPKLHYFDGNEFQEQCHGTLVLTNAMIEETQDKFTFMVLNEDQQEGGEPTRWTLRTESNDEMQGWIHAITRSASIRRVVRMEEEGGDDSSDDELEGSSQTVTATVVAKPKGSAAVLQRVFGDDAGAKASQNMQRHQQILLPKVPASAKLPGRVTESEQLRIDITRQLVPSYFNLVRRNMVDGIPKAIMLCLVNEVKEQMQNACLDVLYKRDAETGQNYVDTLLEEDADFMKQKRRCKEFLKLLQDAAGVVREVQDFNFK